MDLKRRETFLYAIVILAGIIITYLNHFNNSFHFDDSHTIENNIYIKSLKNIPLFFKDASTFSSLPPNQTYRPLVSTSLAVDYYLAGGLENKFYFHLSMFVLFILQGILMFFFFKTMLRKEAYAGALALFSAAWYMLHPACAETVNYIIARSDLISTFFVLLAFVLYQYSPFSRKWHLYLIPIVIGSFAKIPVIMFAPMLFIYSLLFEQESSISIPTKENRKQFIAALKKSMPSFIICALLYFFIRAMDMDTWIPGGSSPFKYLITQPYVIMHYAKTFFLPTQLSADTDWVILESIWDMRFFIGLLFMGTLVALIIFTSRKQEYRVISFGLSWFLIALIPTSSIIPFSEVMNDHRVFFPYIGMAIAITKCLYLLLNFILQKFHFPAGKVTLIFLSVIFLSLYAYGTYQRNEVWKTEESLWRDVTIKSPNNGRGHMNYGLTQMSIGNYEEAEKSFAKTLSLWPYYAYGHINMGILLDARGKTDEAEKYFKTAVAYNPGLPESHYRYASFLLKHGRTEEAREHTELAVKISPGHISSRYLLMEILLQQQDFEGLAAEAYKTLEVLPGDPTTIKYIELSKTKGNTLDMIKAKVQNDPTPQNYLALSLELYNKEDYTGCIEACNKALAIDPDYADAYNNICSAYNQLKEWDKAIDACNKAITINPGFALAKNNLNWAILNKQMKENAR